jgi:hypothetical protein
MFKMIKKRCYLGRYKLGGYSYTKIETVSKSGYFKKVTTEVNRSFVHLEEVIKFAEENKCLINLLGFENEPSFVTVRRLKKMYGD